MILNHDGSIPSGLPPVALVLLHWETNFKKFIYIKFGSPLHHLPVQVEVVHPL